MWTFGHPMVLSTISICIICFGFVVGVPDSDEQVSNVPLYPNNHHRNLFQCPIEAPSTRVWHGTHTAPFYESTYFIHLVIPKRDGFVYTCSGVLLTESLLATNAHCLEGAYSTGWYVYGGVQNFKDLTEGVKVEVNDFQIPKAYYSLGKFNGSWDIALVAVKEAFNLSNPLISTIRLPLPLEDTIPMSAWRDCQVAGSGKTMNLHGTGCESSKRRRHMTGILIGLNCCNQALRLANSNPGPFPPATVCLRNNSDMGCSGDSGAGVVCTSSVFTDPAVFGLIRAGPYCCSKGNNKMNDPIERNVVPFDSLRRAWIQTIINYYTTFNRLPLAEANGGTLGTGTGTQLLINADEDGM